LPPFRPRPTKEISPSPPHRKHGGFGGGFSGGFPTRKTGDVTGVTGGGFLDAPEGSLIDAKASLNEVILECPFCILV